MSTVAEARRPLPGPLAWVSARRVSQALSALLAALGAAYLIDVLVQFNQLIGNTYLDADAASAPVIGQLFGRSGPHQEVVLGQMAWYSTLTYELATRWLPGHRQLWELTPYLLALLSCGLLAWGAWRVAGRWAALVTAAIVLCAAPHTLHLLFSLNDHSPTWFTLALMAALLVALSSGARLHNRWVKALVVLVCAAIAGANLASDTLLVGAGVIPMAAAAVIVCGARPSQATLRALGWTVGFLALTGVFDVLTHSLMNHENVVIPTTVSHSGLGSGESVSTNFKLWWQSVAVLGNGEFFSKTLGFTTALQVACAALSLAGIVAVPIIAWRQLRHTLALPQPARVELSAETARLAWCGFWGISAVLLTGGFIVSTTPVDINSDRYLLGLVYAIAALVPLAARGTVLRRGALAAAAAVFCFTGLLTLAQEQLKTMTAGFPSSSVEAQIASLARRERLTVGYAGYWDAAPITWSSHFAVKVYPVEPCPGRSELCRVNIHYISTWYVPRTGMRSFLVDDTSTTSPAPLVPDLGPPSATYTIGPATVYVFPYDIASHISFDQPN